MHKTISVIFFILIVHLVSGQEEFLRPKGGFSLAFSQAYSNDMSESSIGASLTFKPGLSIGIASQKLGNETTPLFMAGFISDHKEANSYIRGSVMLSYAGSSIISSFGVHVAIAQLINAQKGHPTSVSANLSVVNFSFKENSNSQFSEPSQLVPVVGLAITQGLLAGKTASPFLGLGLAHETKNNTTSFMLSLGLNLNFDGPIL